MRELRYLADCFLPVPAHRRTSDPRVRPRRRFTAMTDECAGERCGTNLIPKAGTCRGGQFNRHRCRSASRSNHLLPVVGSTAKLFTVDLGIGG